MLPQSVFQELHALAGQLDSNGLNLKHNLCNILDKD